MPEFTEEKQEALRRHIEEYYGNDLRPLLQHIDELMFMLLFLDSDKFTRQDIQQAGYFLRSLKTALS